MAVIKIDSEEKLLKLISDVKNKELVCEKFKFEPYELRDILFEEIGVNKEKFDQQYYYYNSKKKLHISESEWEYILISTIGLVAYNDFESDIDRVYKAFESQCEIVEILIKQVQSLKKRKLVYDVDSYDYEYLMNLSTGITHNIIFYLELFAKCYLAISDEKYLKTHDLNILCNQMKNVIFKKGHNNTLFHAHIFCQFSMQVLLFYANCPEDIKEHYIKYNDGIYPSVLIDNLDMLNSFIRISSDSISQYYYDREKYHYLESGLYESLLANANNEEELEKVKIVFGYLKDKNKNEHLINPFGLELF